MSYARALTRRLTSPVTAKRREPTAAAVARLFANGEPGTVFITRKPDEVYQRRNRLLGTELFNTGTYWSKRGAVSITDGAKAAPDGIGMGALVANLSQAAINDFYSSPNTVMGQPDSALAGSVYIWRVSTSGTLKIANPQNQTHGEWSVNMALLSDGWERITASHPAVTVVNPFKCWSLGGESGLHFYAVAGTLSFYVYGPQLERGSGVSDYQRVTDWTTEFLYAGSDYVTRRNLFTNTSFGSAATGTPGTAPTGWSFGIANGTTTAPGDGSLTMACAAGGRHFFNSASIVMAAGETITFSLNIDAVSGASSDVIAFPNASVGSLTSVPLLQVSAGTGRKSLTFTAGGSGATVQIRVGPGVSTGVQSATSLTFSQPQYESGSTPTRYQSVPGATFPYASVNPLITSFTDNTGTTPLTALEQTEGLRLDVKPIFYGPELLTNPSFNTDITGWTNGLPARGTVTASGGAMVVTNAGSAGGFARATAPISVVSGVKYRLAYNITAGNNWQIVRSATSDGVSGTVLVQGSGAVNSSVEFTAPSTGTLYIAPMVNSGTDGQTFTIDNISVREVIAAPNAVGVPLRGDELIGNGQFTSGTGWTAAGGTWTISGGKATHAAGTADQLVYSAAGIVRNVTYEVVFAVSGRTAGQVIAQVGAWNEGPAVTANGTFHQIIAASHASTNGSMAFAASADFNGSLTFVSVKPLYGSHRSQSSSGARGKVSARYNMLAVSDDFANAAWVGSGTIVPTVNANVFTAPDGTLTGDEIVQQGGTAGARYQTITSSATLTNYTAFLAVRAGTTNAASLSIFRNAPTTAHMATAMEIISGPGTVTPSGGIVRLTGLEAGWTVVKIVAGAVTLGDALRLMIYPEGTGASTVGASIGVWGADVRASCYAYLPWPQRTWDATTGYDDTGFPARFVRSGTQGEATGVIDFSAYDKVQMWAGIAKLSDAAAGIIIEASDSALTNNGSFYLVAPAGASPSYQCALRGDAAVIGTTSPLSYASPHCAVVSATGDISGVTKQTLSVNGVQVSTSSTSVGGGNLGAYQLNFGARANKGTSAGSTNATGDEFALIVRGGATPDATTLNMVNRYCAGFPLLAL